MLSRAASKPSGVAPSRARGLKRKNSGISNASSGRAFTGAWIETSRQRLSDASKQVAPSRARGLKLQ